MNNPTDDKREFFRLLLLELNDACTQEEFDQLCRQLKDDPRMRDDYVEFMILYSGLLQNRESVEVVMSASSDRDLCVLDPNLWAQLSREEQDAPAIEIRDDKNLTQETMKYQKIARPPRIYPKGYLWFSIVSIAATFLLILYVWTNPRHIPRDVATVTDIYQAQWGDSGNMIQKGTRLFDNRKSMNLTRGVLKVQFDDGVQVIVQGPAVFSLESEGKMRLTHGKLYARVPKQGIGFRVDTPSCGVIDLGTEFGVNVTGHGQTNVHLFKGKASLVTASDERVQQSQILYQNQAKEVTSSGEIRTIPLHDNEFVRDFNSEDSILWNGENLNLAYVASGGDGFKPGTPNAGIDQATGKLVVGNDEEIFRNVPEVEGYTLAPELPYVDGVFVPDGEHGQVQITSRGHIFDGFPDTNGQYFMSIGAFSSVNLYTADGRKYSSLHLTDYPEETSVNLCLHANSGITFDLQKIRESMPFLNITQFSSVYGIPKTREDQDNVTSDYYVFVDGVPRMIKQGVSNRDKPGHIVIPLNETDRFLTLVCTDGHDNFGDWSLFVNPVLELELAD